MALRQTSLALAVALTAIISSSVSAQGGAASKGTAPDKNAAAAAQKNATTPAADARSTASQASAATPSASATANTERAKCKDGSTYSGKTRQGACSGHGGVVEWLAVTKGSAPKGATARCNDGTYYLKAERQGACSGHKGVAEWLKKG